MSDQFGVIALWNGRAAVVRISKETEKTVTASEWESWHRGEWGRETRMDKARVLARFATQEAAQAASDAALAVYLQHIPSVDAARIALRKAETDRSDAWLAAIQSEPSS